MAEEMHAFSAALKSPRSPRGVSGVFGGGAEVGGADAALEGAP